MATNDGNIIFEEESDVTDLGKVILSRYAIANIFLFRDLKNVCRVTHDSANQDDFVAHMDKKKIKFQCNEQGLYIYNPNNSYLGATKRENLRNTGLEKAISQLQNNSGSQLNTAKKK